MSTDGAAMIFFLTPMPRLEPTSVGKVAPYWDLSDALPTAPLDLRTLIVFVSF